MTDRIRCDEVLTDLLTYLDREIDGPKRAQIDRHLEECPGCSARAEFEKALKARLAELGEGKVPAMLRRKLKQLIDTF